MVTTEHPTGGLLEQERALDHSRLVRTAAKLRSLSPQFGWPALLIFVFGPFGNESPTLERILITKGVAVLLVLGAYGLRLSTRGYHRKSGFVINGPYRYIRNPVEVGAVLGMLGGGLLLNLPLWYLALFVFLAVSFLSFASLAYEKELLAKLKENYFRYTKRVKRWVPSLLPGVNRVNRDYSLLAAVREEKDSLIWAACWIVVYAIRSHFFSRFAWW
jgi:protein-S-isoprenylcysteine O-methyltransferase Ste14